MDDAEVAAGLPGERLARARRRHLGGARRPPPLHALEGHGLGGHRPRGALDRGVRPGRRREGRQMLPHLKALRERIHAEVCQRGFNARLGAFTQSYGSEHLDASVLNIPLVGFLPASDHKGMKGNGRRDREGAAMRRLRPPLRHAERRGRAAGRRGRVPGLQASRLADNYAFAGSPARPSRCSSASSACATTWGCSPRSTIRGCNARWWATSCRRSRTWPSSRSAQAIETRGLPGRGDVALAARRGRRRPSPDPQHPPPHHPPHPPTPPPHPPPPPPPPPPPHPPHPPPPPPHTHPPPQPPPPPTPHPQTTPPPPKNPHHPPPPNQN